MENIVKNRVADDKQSLKILVLNHYVKDYKNLRPYGVLDEDIKKIEKVDKEISDANVVQSLICKKLGLSSPDIMQVLSKKKDSSILTGIINIDEVDNILDFLKADKYHRVMNNVLFQEDIKQRLDSDELTKAERDFLKKMLLFSYFSKEGNRPIDRIFFGEYNRFNELFSEEALAEIIKTRIAKLATFDTTNNLKGTYYKINDKFKVDKIYPVLTGTNKKSLVKACSGERENLLYQTEFAPLPLNLRAVLNEIKTNEKSSEVLNKNQIGQIVEDLSSQSIYKTEKEFYEQTGISVDSKYLQAVDSQIDDICQELSN